MHEFSPLAWRSPLRGLLPWLAAWVMISVLHRQPPSNLALLLVLASALSAIWWKPWQVVFASTFSVLAFNYFFISPRGQLAIELQEDAILLFTMLGVSITVALMMSRMRILATNGREVAERAEQLRALSERLRTEESPRRMAEILREALSGLFHCKCYVLLEGHVAAEQGEPLRNDLDALTLVQKQDHEIGPGTGRYESFPGWALPVRGASAVLGAALVGADFGFALREHARALCNLVGNALERRLAQEAAELARSEERSQSLRNALLASIAHDHRTPLATILSAASSIEEQHDKLSAAQRQSLARTIIEECKQLIDITQNTLQLARFDTGKIELHEDWQSAEELIGSVIQRARRRFPTADIRIATSPPLPLFRGDGTLLEQLIDNLVNNAVQHAGSFGPLEVGADVAGRQLSITVADCGPPIDAGLRSRIFEPFYRAGQAPQAHRGAGLGLAVCSAIASVHHGSLDHTAGETGGNRFTLRLPLPDEPLTLPVE